MSWSGHVWREAGSYGPLGGFEAQKNLGQYTFPNPPEIGMIVTLRDREDYQVVDASMIGYCHVRPMKMKGR